MDMFFKPEHVSVAMDGTVDDTPFAVFCKYEARHSAKATKLVRFLSFLMAVVSLVSAIGLFLAAPFPVFGVIAKICVAFIPVLFFVLLRICLDAIKRKENTIRALEFAMTSVGESFQLC